MEQNVSHYQPSDEIDLRDIARTLWASKLLILLVTLVVTCIAAVYVFFSTPVYETYVQTLPPTASGLSGYNIGSQLTGVAISGITQTNSSAAPPSIKELSIKEAYNDFLQHLTSNTVRQQFFENVYLPAQRTTTDQINKDKLKKQLAKALAITLPTKPTDNTVRVSFEGTNPQTIANWADTYVAMAIKATQKELLNDLAGEVALRTQGIDDQISTLRKIALVARQDRITRLKDALQVAKSIGLEVPANSGNLVTSYTGETTYLRGAKALQAELDVLEKRSNDDPYIDNLPDLLKKRALLKSIDLNPSHLSVATIDQAATVPQEPVKPKKLLVLILGVILGSILGVLIALIRKISKRL
ncbi:Wzz/FepE/Etk N-terminal domain-containing protein [Paralcaligenes sp. KSB-10]|uniref:LPS O-antigen chain length determinant protein WzzB n=1 Tax=Paralcaligenes sp. KSB-10 TaxID=2901142 RepID=UPI001E62BCD5|nr:Wzz/FepE/Etk N-terminal domain-containing protein [Paralcaligenes sp. KSB-10]UHL63232.1 Wzz/FepE/Etk N-terminal domain-containing protein [Paralcaligenes sp. KSB-10]